MTVLDCPNASIQLRIELLVGSKVYPFPRSTVPGPKRWATRAGRAGRWDRCWVSIRSRAASRARLWDSCSARLQRGGEAREARAGNAAERTMEPIDQGTNRPREGNRLNEGPRPRRQPRERIRRPLAGRGKTNWVGGAPLLVHVVGLRTCWVKYANTPPSRVVSCGNYSSPRVPR